MVAPSFGGTERLKTDGDRESHRWESGVVLPFRWNPKLDQDIKRIRVINAELRVILHSAWAEKKIKNGEGDQKNQANDQVDAGIPPGFGGRCQDND